MQLLLVADEISCKTNDTQKFAEFSKNLPEKMTFFGKTVRDYS
jgi:hypothetical protein